MIERNESIDIDFGGPATYLIIVQGVISERWIDRLGGMTVSTFNPGQGAARTTLSGPIRDQAELSGVLVTLYGLHLLILKVEKIEALSEDPMTDV